MAAPSDISESSASSPLADLSARHTATPVVASLRAIPVAGRDGMLLNLSGAHGPFFTRNLLILTDSAGRTGIGEVPGGQKITQTLQDAAELVVGQPLGRWQAVLRDMGDLNAADGLGRKAARAEARVLELARAAGCDVETIELEAA